jgi:hypothetical protein
MDVDEQSEDVVGDGAYDAPPRQVLFGADDYFNLDLEEYFGRCTPFGGGESGQRLGNVTVDWVGVDAHVATSRDHQSVRGNLIGAARILTMESDAEQELSCTEVFAWSNYDDPVDGSDQLYGTKYVCRAAGSFYFLDICANTKRLYATFQSGSDSFENGDHRRAMPNRHRPLMEIVDDESMVNEDGEPIRMSRSVFCLPLVKHEGSSPDEISSYFPLPESCINAQYPVSSFSVDVTGRTLIVGTIHGTVEMWHTGVHSNTRANPRRLEILSVRESFLRRARSMTVGARSGAVAMQSGDDKPESIEFSNDAADARETQDDLALIGETGEDELPHKHPTTKIAQIYIPRHLPVQRCGFVTKQRNSENGTTLLLWQTRNTLSGVAPGDDLSVDHFQIVSMINLPLSSRCHPEVHYDGRRLVVFGKDHIGLIFLVYHVLSTRYDQDEFRDEKMPSFTKKKTKAKGEESGGVINLLPERRIKFVNRIRHAGLGGLEYFDSLMMTANERFIVVNTKCGNLIASDGERGASQGLLVIDLQDHETGY